MIVLSALSSLQAAPPAGLAAEPKAPDLAIDSYRLPNGLKVVLHRDPAVPRVTVCVAYHVGSKNERAGRTGFAHFFEHMMFRGTEHVPNYDIPLQETGAQSNAFTSEDMTVYYETVSSNYLERALYLEAERLGFLPSALDQERFDTEREVVKNERRQSFENVPYGLAGETLLAHVFPKGHPYSWSVIGSMRDLDRANLDDLKRFFAEFYHPGNATLALVGDFDPNQARAWIDEYFGPLRAGPARRPVEVPAAQPVAERLEQADEVQLPRLYWAWPIVADDHPDAPALDLLATVLAGGDASRLHRALVLDRSLATEVAAESDTKEVAGLFSLQATAAEGIAPDAIAEVLATELDRLREGAPPTAEELTRAQAQHEIQLCSFLTLPLGRALVLSLGFAQQDDPAYYRRDFARYVQVTPADLLRVARTYLTPEKVALIVRPARPGEPEAEAVSAGPLASGRDDDSVPPPRPPQSDLDWSKLPGPVEPLAFHAPKIVRRRLSNGLAVWVVPWRTLPIVTARLLIPAGSNRDPAGQQGLATLTAAALDQGTSNRTATELAEDFERLGASLTVEAGTEDTVLSLNVLSHNLNPALGLLGQVLTRPRFAPEDVDRERQLQLADLLQGPDNPLWIAQRAFRVLLYGSGHPYGQPLQGYTESVKGLTTADVRRFFEQWLSPTGTTLIVVGDVEPDALLTSLETALGSWKSGTRPTADPASPTHQPEPGVAYLVDKPGAVQSVLCVGRRWGPRKGGDYFATLIGNRILGADFLSRLNQNLREQHGFTYGAGSSFTFRRAGSVWQVSTSVRADATAPALREVLAELDALAGAKPFTAEEVLVSRTAEARSYPESFESPSGIAGILQEMAQFDLPPDYLETFLDRLQTTEAPSISRAMTAVVAPAERFILIVGDRQAIEPELKGLGFREVRLITPDGQPIESAGGDQGPTSTPGGPEPPD